MFDRRRTYRLAMDRLHPVKPVRIRERLGELSESKTRIENSRPKKTGGTISV
jgi:hypothetical protein